MHSSTFEYLKPTDDQLETMAKMRSASKAFGDAVDALIPDGPDKTYMLRKFREVAMWANIAITRQYDGAPRS